MRLAFVILLFLTSSTLAQDITLWTWALKPRFDPLIRQTIADFEQQNPGVRVEWIDVPGEAIDRKLFSAAAAGQLPDVINLPDKAFVRFAQLGAFKPLDAILPGDPDKQYVAGALSGCRFDGKLMGVPWYLSNEIAVINVTLLEQGGLTLDVTTSNSVGSNALGRDWKTLRTQAPEFHRKTGKFLFMTRLGEIDLLGQIVAEDLLPIVPHAEGGFQSNLTKDSRIVSLMKEWVELYRSGAMPRESATGTYPDLVQAFKEERVAVVNANLVRVIQRDAPELFARIVPRPAIVGAKNVGNLSSVMLGVSSQSKHPELAAKLLWHMTTPKYQEELALLASRLPSTIASMNSPRFAPTAPDALSQATALSMRELPKSMSFVQPTGTWPDLEKIFGEGMKRALLSDVPAEKALTDIEAEWDRILRADAKGLSWK